MVQRKVVTIRMAGTMADMRGPTKVGWTVAKRVGLMAVWMAPKIYLAGWKPQ